MKDSVQEGIDFCEITFAIPAQQFGITCSLSTEEALPVVSEFVLRVIHACEAVTLRQLEEYFGFSSSEIATVTRALVEDRLLVWEEDSLEITSMPERVLSIAQIRYRVSFGLRTTVLTSFLI